MQYVGFCDICYSKIAGAQIWVVIEEMSKVYVYSRDRMKEELNAYGHQ